MSGHSKWSQIKRQKGAADKKRGQVFSKLASLLTVAARYGGGDSAMNPRLRIVIEQARTENMPKENIERAIKRGTGELGGATIEELRYEVYGPGGVAIVIDGATDNPNRTTAAVKAVLNKYGGKLATVGAVAFQFHLQGLLNLPLVGQEKSHDELELAVIEAGALSYEVLGDTLQVVTDPKDLSHIKEALETQQITIDEVKLSLEPLQTVSVSDSSLAKQILHLMETLEELDDVTAVTANFEIPEAILHS